MVQRSLVAVLGWSLLVACGGDGGRTVPAPAPGGTERPATDPQDPRPDDQEPTRDSQDPARNDQDPISSELPGTLPGAQANGNGGSGNPGPGGGTGGGNTAGGGNPGPGGGKKCTLEGDQCAGCDNLCDACECTGSDNAACDGC